MENTEFRKKIISIHNLNSAECLEEIKLALNNTLIKDFKKGIYMKKYNGHWLHCNVQEAIEFMTDKFDKHLKDVKSEINVSQEDVQIIDKIIYKWINGNIDKYELLRKIVGINDDEKEDESVPTYIKLEHFKRNISSNEESKMEDITILNDVLKKSKLKESIIQKINSEENKTIFPIPIEKREISKQKKENSHTKVVSKFIQENVVITSDSDDFVLFKEFYNRYMIWCEQNQESYCDWRAFGRCLKSNGLTCKSLYTDGTSYKIYMGLKYK